MIDDVIFGCVSQSGAQAWEHVLRNAVLSSRITAESVPGTSVDETMWLVSTSNSLCRLKL